RHVGRLAALGDQLADTDRSFGAAAVLDLAAQILVEGRGGRQRAARRIVDDLGVDVLARAVHAEARATVGAGSDGFANALLAPFHTLEADGHFLWRSLLLLAFLARDELADIAHALALVGLGTTETADVCSHLANL